ncbi:MAG: acylphosphatase [Chloroflexota bacterium]|nr:acylphosphatase [Chloroflexota bacterium]
MAGAARLHAKAFGWVQGVGFRFFVLARAERHRVTGYVRNEWSGDCVEVVAEGADGPLRALLEDVRRGPPGSVVREVEVEWQEATGEFDRFQIRH